MARRRSNKGANPRTGLDKIIEGMRPVHPARTPYRLTRMGLHFHGAQLEHLEQRLLLSTITVNSLADNLTSGDGLVTLREAIIAANNDTSTDLGDTGSGPDHIVFSVDGTIEFTRAGAEDDGVSVPETGDLDILDDLTITGTGPDTTIIDAAGLDRVIEVHTGVTAVLSGLKITGGSGSEGGGIRNTGTLTVIDSEIDNNESTGVAPSGSEFDLEVRFIDSSLSASQQAVFSTAAARWEQIILGDLPDVFASIGLVDDIVIDASAPAIDGVGGTLGRAGPLEVRVGSFLPAYGIMEFDSADLDSLEASGRLNDVILHEMGHVLGFGTIWEELGLLMGAGTGNPRYTGEAAVAQYNSVFGLSTTRIPVANTGGAGTRDSHWRESVFGDELMTGFLGSGSIHPLSKVSVGSMLDLGYEVNIDAADSYTPPVATGDAALVHSGTSGRLLALDVDVVLLDSLTDQTVSDWTKTDSSLAAEANGDASAALVITTGQADGGGIFNSGTLTLTNTNVINNTSAGNGGGVASNGSLTMTGGLINDNTAAVDGGGIATDGPLMITNGTIRGNQANDTGGGLSLAGMSTITDTAIQANQAVTAGGIDNSGTLTIAGSEISTNQAIGEDVTPSEFNIEVNFTDNSLSPSQQAVFTDAAERWQEIIIADVPDVFVTGFGLIDDIVIDAAAPDIDGPGGILGQAGPTAFRSGSFLPARGIMEFDASDIINLVATGQFENVILHEMGHVLGIGSIWDDLGLLTGAGGSDPRFTGPLATAEYNSIFGVSEASVPVANTGGAGTRDAHWREAVFENELMTGFLDSGTNPISRITVAQLDDIGYEVNLNAADPYTPPSSLVAARMNTEDSAEPVIGRMITLDFDPIIVPTADAALSNHVEAGNAGDGGGIFNNGLVVAASTTISGNMAKGSGAGLANQGTLVATSVTVTNNQANTDGGTGPSGGGLAANSGTATLHNTLIAQNLSGAMGTTINDDVVGTLDSAGSFNLIGVDSGMTGLTNELNGNQVGTTANPINPRLGELANNGGPTQTHAPLADSPVIDQGGAAAGIPDHDQRGLPRTVDLPQAPNTEAAGANGTDIGAFEVQPEEEMFGPRVLAVLIASTQWQPTLFDNLISAGIGDQAGYLIPQGNEQLTNIVWDNIDTISIRFDEPIQAPTTDDLVITSGGSLTVTNAAYDESTKTATWTLSGPLPNGGVTVMLSDSVVDTQGNTLDGEFTDTDPLPSGNGQAMGIFEMSLNVLAGDFNDDGTTNDLDIDALGAGIREATTDPRLDITGDGLVDFLGDTTYLVEQVLKTRFGDTNLDRRVSVADLSAFSLHFGLTSVGWAMGDFNGDTINSVADLSLLALNFDFDGTTEESADETTQSFVIGDVTGDGEVTAQDINAVTNAISTHNTNPLMDLNGDQQVDVQDRDYLLREVMNTDYGDVNLDGQIDRADYRIIRSNYRLTNARWEDGDLNGDARVDYKDLRLYYTTKRNARLSEAGYAVLPSSSVHHRSHYAAAWQYKKQRRAIAQPTSTPPRLTLLED